MKFPHPSTYPGLTPTDVTLINNITTFTRKYFQNTKFDSSHDFQHVMRVTNTAIQILNYEQRRRVAESIALLDPTTVILGALLHDVEDKKYSSKDGENDKESEVKSALLRFHASDALMTQVSNLVGFVSYSTESRNPELVSAFLQQCPELGIVQDADRLDAIGAIGIARCCWFGGAKSSRGLGSAIEHFEEKLLKLEGMMKTTTGREMAAERSRRIRDFMSWWTDEGGPDRGLAAGSKDEDEWH